jgi:tRNA A-37 threonylcarbamoyl transferase component Bud32
MSDSGQDRLPSQLGRYRVLRRLAQGGMAEIFLAEATDLPEVRRVAVLKRLLPEYARDEPMRALFLNEARVMASLNHPNVVQVLEVFRTDEELFIAMEHIEGEALATLVGAAQAAGHRLPLEESLQVIAGVLAGLDYVHERKGPDGRPMQLIHRDVTARNVLISYEGAVKLIDFGIARRANAIGVTTAGVVRGTIPYMSPEQARGQLLDRRSDLFSVGILLYELTVGRRLYDGDDNFEVLKRIIEAPVPSPAAASPGYPPLLDEVVGRALQKKPIDRFQSAAEMLSAIENVAAALGLPLSATPLKATMQSLFSKHIEAWRSVRQDAGEGQARALATLTASGGLAYTSAGIDAASTGVHAPRARRGIGMAVVGAMAIGAGGLYAVTWLAPGKGREVAAVEDAARAPEAARPLDAASPVTSPPDLAIAYETVTPKPPHPRPRQHEEHGKAELVLEARPWCEVSIDGVARGPTPIVVPLGAGAHKVRLRNPEFDIDRTLTLTLKAGQRLKKKLEFPTKK